MDMSYIKLTCIAVLLLVVTMSTLAWIERSQRTSLHENGWWALSFVDPSPSSSDASFVIENFSSQSTFDYQIEGMYPTLRQSATVRSGGHLTIPVAEDLGSQVKIIVTTENDEKTIYK